MLININAAIYLPIVLQKFTNKINVILSDKHNLLSYYLIYFIFLYYKILNLLL